jgi:PAS domain S-box-containing protein
MNNKASHQIREKLKADHDRARKELASLRKENAALRRSLNHRETLVQGLPMGFLMIQGEKIMDANAEILSRLGYAQEEILNHRLREFVPPRLKTVLGEILGKGRPEKPGSDPNEIELIGKDGSLMAWDIKVRKIRSNGRFAYLMLLTGNEGRRKREQNIAESAKGAALCAMASGLSPALMNAVRSLRLGVDLTRQSLGPGHDREVTDMEEAALSTESVGRALECLARENCEPSFRVPLDLKKVVRDTLTAAGLRVREEADKRVGLVKIKTYLRSVSPVMGDPEEIRQMLSHVITNAVDAMPGGGSLYLSIEENAGYAHIYIQDSGVGIPPQICERILDPFFTTKGTEKLGLGLSLSRAIIRRHGGDMEVSSKKNEGTVVTVRLPLAKREGKDTKKRPRKRAIKHARILIIEQAPMIGELLMQALKSKGCGVEMAATATEALAQLRKKTFDMVIVGADISEVKGASLARRIKNSKAAVPVALIASADAFDRRDLRHLPFADLVITKPIDMSQAIERITKALSGYGKTRHMEDSNTPHSS